jgi:hypothetical protein
MRKLLVLLGLAALVGAAWAAENASNTGAVKVSTQGMVINIKVPKPGAKKPVEVPIPFGKEATLPAGKYDVATIQLFKQDAKGQVWCLNAVSNLGDLKTLSVTPDQAAAIEGGETLKVRTQVVVAKEKPPRKGAVEPNPPPPPTTVITVYVDYVGKSGEHYGPKAIIGSAPVQSRPVVRIKDEGDKVLAEGTYAFGSAGFG